MTGPTATTGADLKVWGNTHPRFLSRQHLLGEHHEIHTMIGGGWSNHAESKRFQYPGGYKYLVLRHELLRREMDRRWPGRHNRYKHPTPVEYEDISIGWLMDATTIANAHISVSSFPVFMDAIGFPKTTLKYDTPWDKYGVTFDRYQEVATNNESMNVLGEK